VEGENEGTVLKKNSEREKEKENGQSNQISKPKWKCSSGVNYKTGRYMFNSFFPLLIIKSLVCEFNFLKIVCLK